MSYTRDENGLIMRGTLVRPLTAEHEAYGETLYVGAIEILRLSGTADTLPITVPARAMKPLSLGDTVEIGGELRSYNRHMDGASRLLIRPFAKRIVRVDGQLAPLNMVTLSGSVCRPTVFRVTPFGREITDLLIAVNRSHGKADYIPCIAWGSAAHAAKELSVGTRISVEGRLQSREYTKNENGSTYAKTAYELSCIRLDVNE